jgi:hypothetical protein
MLTYDSPTTKSNTTPTTFPASPKVDGVQVECWSTFGDEVREFMAQHVPTIATEQTAFYEYVSQKAANMDLTYGLEEIVKGLFKEFYQHVVQRANSLIFGQDLKMSTEQKACLHTDLELMLYKDTLGQLLAIIEVRTPKEFPYGGNLAEHFKDEQLRLKPTPTSLKAWPSCSGR